MQDDYNKLVREAAGQKTVAPREIFRHAVSPGSKLLYLVLLMHGQKNGRLPTHTRIAKEIGITPKTVTRYLKELSTGSLVAVSYSNLGEVASYDVFHPADPTRLLAKLKAPRRRPKDGRKQIIPRSLQWQVWLRDDFTCRDCGSRENLSVDHIIPESKGGTLAVDNLRTLCRTCNSKKGTRDA